MNAFLHGPSLWYLNRSTGLVVLALLTVTTVLGVLSTGQGRRLLPRFVGQALHRNLALWSVVLLGLHITTAVVDSYVDIRWWQAVVPWAGASYMPLWLGLGTLSFDLIVLVAVTSLVRARMKHRTWRFVHLLAYGAWGVAVAHGLGIGTDLRQAGWERDAVYAAVALVAGVALIRLVGATARLALREATR
ncbi:ferric reductase-like transmembrane domain-containing protein [Nocardioides cynanchi]|uniref:ferric reductase-like transmembrane domain-containing protein n=1 Tax=Nocardioides cynanchi TaxID=2558918 RepID=UPI001247FFEB|nr:ferric reductase-like transmembrane domain-containing protein [Nocardioides cynanchi]